MAKEEIRKMFVYGTLKVGGFFAGRFDEVRVKSTPGTIQGTLFKGAYPQVKLGGDRKVHGEVHEFDKFEEVLAAFDRIEGFNERNPAMSLYQRKVTEVETADGTEMAFVYEYNHSTDDSKIVEDGVWKTH